KFPLFPVFNSRSIFIVLLLSLRKARTCSDSPFSFVYRKEAATEQVSDSASIALISANKASSSLIFSLTIVPSSVAELQLARKKLIKRSTIYGAFQIILLVLK